MSIPGRATAAFQGEPGAFSFFAIQKLLGPDSTPLPFPTFREVFESIQNGVAEFGVVPIENTLYGSVHENYDHMLKFDIGIIGETTLRIEHALICCPGVEFHQIRRAFSHPVALDQCRRFFADNAAIKPTPYYDTAGSVKMLMQEGYQDAAAVASAGAADLYGARVLRNGIEDNQDNFTRFFLLTKQRDTPEMNGAAGSLRKTSLALTTSNSPGALCRALSCFANRKLNLTKLESRPLRDSPWEYLFYLDIAGYTDDTVLRDALIELGELTSFVKVLGSYSPKP